MKQWKKKTAVVAFSGALALSSLTGCSSYDDDTVVATVGEDEISLGVANFYARLQQAQYESYYASLLGTSGEELWEDEVSDGETYEESVKSSLLESLENMYLLKQHASDYDVELTEEEQTAIEEAAAAFDEANTLEDKEAVSGYQKYIEEYLELVTIQNKMEEPMKEGVDEEVSDEEAAQKAMSYVYFSYTTTDEDGNSVDMDGDEKEALLETAQEFADKVNDGTADFETAASEAGVDVNTTTFDSESTSPTEEVVEAADALENVGDITDVIETDYGLYVAQVTSMLDRDATDEEKESIIEERQEEQYDSLLEEWREDTDITEYKRVWNSVSFINLGVTISESEDEYDDTTSTEDTTTDDTTTDDTTTDDTSTEEATE